MSDRINDFLDKICASVKYKTMHSEIREEFKNHIDEAVFEFETFSRGHEAAVNMSLSKLGNADCIAWFGEFLLLKTRTAENIGA